MARFLTKEVIMKALRNPLRILNTLYILYLCIKLQASKINITVISKYLSLELQPKIVVFSTNMARFLTKEVIMKALRNPLGILKQFYI